MEKITYKEVLLDAAGSKVAELEKIELSADWNELTNFYFHTGINVAEKHHSETHSELLIVTELPNGNRLHRLYVKK